MMFPVVSYWGGMGAWSNLWWHTCIYHKQLKTGDQNNTAFMHAYVFFSLHVGEGCGSGFSLSNSLKCTNQNSTEISMSNTNGQVRFVMPSNNNNIRLTHSNFYASPYSFTLNHFPNFSTYHIYINFSIYNFAMNWYLHHMHTIYSSKLAHNGFIKIGSSKPHFFPLDGFISS